MRADPHREAEIKRLAALRRYAVLDSPPEDAFDAIVRLAARICKTPVSLITLIDEARQWFKARVGWEVNETSREISFCAQAIEGTGLCMVPDALTDMRFRDNPLVRGDPSIRFYAAMPLVTSDGFSLGTLCVIDRVPRAQLTEHQRESLELLANETMAQLELRRVLKETSDLRRALEDVNLELDAFAAAVAHDLRTPLRHIDGFATLIGQASTDDPKIHQHAARIRGACTQARDIIEALLRLSRVSHSELRVQEVDLSAIAREIAAELRSTEPARRVEIAIAEGITARGDTVLLRLGLTNLLSNAWKFTRQRPDARIEFGAHRSNGSFEYYVRDNGIGFDPARSLLPSRPFIRREGSYEGVGLGLTIVERILRRHGGTLRAEGVPEAGATFYFTVPA